MYLVVLSFLMIFKTVVVSFTFLTKLVFTKPPDPTPLVNLASKSFYFKFHKIPKMKTGTLKYMSAVACNEMVNLNLKKVN